jgi:subfamily B ATP-binding cassette protein MsbA
VSLLFGDRYALKDISFTVQSGATLAIVGKSGSGKTSITNLLVRFYDATSGFISIGDRPIHSMTISSLRRNIALVTQDIMLFDASIAENISYSSDKASFDDIVEASKKAYAHEFIMNLPMGYNTPIGVGGATLSGGQKQRLSIARAFLKNAPILILDEPTSALDVVSEAEVTKAINELRVNKTTIIIAHKLYTVANLDKIIILEDGLVKDTTTGAGLSSINL